MKSTAYMFSRFLLVGGSGFLIDVLLTHALIAIQLSPWVARVPAITGAMIFTWLANRRLTYRVKRERSLAEALRYACVALIGGIINYLFYLSLIQSDFLPIVSIAVATAMQSILSFYAYHRFVFAR